MPYNPISKNATLNNVVLSNKIIPSSSFLDAALDGLELLQSTEDKKAYIETVFAEYGGVAGLKELKTLYLQQIELINNKLSQINN